MKFYVIQKDNTILPKAYSQISHARCKITELLHYCRVDDISQTYSILPDFKILELDTNFAQIKSKETQQAIIRRLNNSNSLSPQQLSLLEETKKELGL